MVTIPEISDFLPILITQNLMNFLIVEDNVTFAPGSTALAIIYPPPPPPPPPPATPISTPVTVSTYNFVTSLKEPEDSFNDF